MKPLNSLVPMAFVASVPRSIEFYKLLGFKVGNTFVPPGQAEASWAWIESGGAHLMVARASEPVIASQQAVLFYLYCEDVSRHHVELQKLGVVVGEIQYPFYAPRGEFRVTDPDGYALMVTHS
jgi:catechol 2,3-dioxygenase-like lactoylglutathione lyase family enzyme